MRENRGRRSNTRRRRRRIFQRRNLFRHQVDNIVLVCARRRRIGKPNRPVPQGGNSSSSSSSSSSISAFFLLFGIRLCVLHNCCSRRGHLVAMMRLCTWLRMWNFLCLRLRLFFLLWVCRWWWRCGARLTKNESGVNAKCFPLLGGYALLGIDAVKSRQQCAVRWFLKTIGKKRRRRVLRVREGGWDTWYVFFWPCSVSFHTYIFTHTITH